MSISSQTLTRPFVARLVTILALGSGLLLQCIGAWTDSQTTDEGAHLGAGLSYWRTSDWRLNPEHPPLVKLFAALPLLGFHQLQPSADPVTWSNRDQWEIGRMVLYKQLDPRTETQLVLWLARVPIILIWVGLGLIVWRWAEERTSPWGGALAVTAYTFEPTLLGHGHLITTDLALAAGMTATVWLSTKLYQRPSWRSIAMFAIVFSLTQLTKFSAILLWPTIFGLLAIGAAWTRERWTWMWWRRTFFTTILFSAIMTWGMYGFERLPPSADPRIAQLWQERDAVINSDELKTFPRAVQWLVTSTPQNSPLRNFLEAASQIPIPAYSYWRGFFAVTSHNAMGHAAYLLGEQRSQGWWYYFPLALAVKMSLPMLGLLALLVYSAWRQRTSMNNPITWILIGPILLYLLWSFTSKINIGVRHVLPIFPIACVALASLVKTSSRVWYRVIVIGLALLVPIVTLSAWPNTIGYFNAFAGGTSGGHRILLDSNLDWNQDLWRLRDWIDRQGQPPMMIALFGSVPVSVVHPQAERIALDSEVARSGPPRKLIAVSKGLLYSVDVPLRWLRQLPPSATVGSSILIYDLR